MSLVLDITLLTLMTTYVNEDADLWVSDSLKFPTLGPFEILLQIFFGSGDNFYSGFIETCEVFPQ